MSPPETCGKWGAPEQAGAIVLLQVSLAGVVRGPLKIGYFGVTDGEPRPTGTSSGTRNQGARDLVISAAGAARAAE